MTHIELQMDGLVGPTHHYAGLSHGNVACMDNAQSVANPKMAALQGLKKMKYVADLGIPQLVMPPLLRPDLALLYSRGFTGTPAQQIEAAFVKAPELIAACYSASSMWVANAATIAPSPDTADNKIHLTPANLSSKLHRAIEALHTAHMLQQLFPNDSTAAQHFMHHNTLPDGKGFSDEGAANHMRLCAQHGAEGLHIFVYGKAENISASPTIFAARQHRNASKKIAVQHGLNEENVFFIQQHPDAIDAGCFHNDVIAMSDTNRLIYHEKAFLDDALLRAAVEQFAVVQGITLRMHIITDADLPLADAVSSYLFNSQLLTLADGSTLLISPAECEENLNARAQCERLVAEGFFDKVEYIDLRESMKNGGGPACLRLRMAVTSDELAAIHPPALMNDTLYTKLTNWVNSHYRDRLTQDDLRDPQLIDEVYAAMEELSVILAVNFRANR